MNGTQIIKSKEERLAAIEAKLASYNIKAIENPMKKRFVSKSSKTLLVKIRTIVSTSRQKNNSRANICENRNLLLGEFFQSLVVVVKSTEAVTFPLGVNGEQSEDRIYRHLDDVGMIKVGVNIKVGDVVLGITSDENKDISRVVTPDEVGIVISTITTVDMNGDKTISINLVRKS